MQARTVGVFIDYVLLMTWTIRRKYRFRTFEKVRIYKNLSASLLSLAVNISLESGILPLYVVPRQSRASTDMQKVEFMHK